LSVGGVEKVNLYTPTRENARDECGRFAVDAPGDQHLVVLRKMREKNRGNCPHSRGADETRFGTFEPRHLLGELGRVGMTVAGVDESRGQSVAKRIHMIEVRRAVDDAQVDRWNERLAGRACAIRCACTDSRRCGGVRVTWHGLPSVSWTQWGARREPPAGY